MTLRFNLAGDIVKADAIIFDKDGTLNNSLEIMPKVARSRINQIKSYIPEAQGLEDQLAKAIGLQDAKIDPRSPMMVGSRIETVAAAATILYLTKNIRWDRAINAIWKAFIDGDDQLKPEDKIKLFPGVSKLLENIYFHGGKIAIVTNDVRESTESFINLSGIGKYVEAVACSDEVKRGKPEPDLALLVMDRMGVQPEKCIIVGDSVWDLEMGRNAGVKATVGVLTGSSNRSDFAGCTEYILNSLADIKIFAD